jgi:hypothetical protein
MNTDEIRAEIERRKQRARDLRLREMLWRLYEHLRRYEKLLVEDPQIVHPELRDTLQISSRRSIADLDCSNADIQLRTGVTSYKLSYKEKRTSFSEDGETRTTHATLTLEADGARVLKFEIERSTTTGYCGPVWRDSMGEITRFIDGAWVGQVVELLQKIQLYERAVRDERELPALKQQAKRFGL